MSIREAFPADAAALAHLISTANREVALAFGLNAENCPKHPSFCTEAWVLSDLEGGTRYFILEAEGNPLGCVAYERPRPGKAYLNRLALLPGQQRRGIGTRLVRHIVELARADEVQTISIGVIGEHQALQRWYRGLGFVTGESKRFPRLPFTVTYLSLSLR